jgi:hypothetical protein
MATAMYVCVNTYIHALPGTAKLESQRTAGSKTPGEGAQRPRAALNYYYATVGPKGHRRTRGGDQEEHQTDRRAHGGSKRHHEDPRAQQEDRERQQEDRREQRGDRSRP